MKKVLCIVLFSIIAIMGLSRTFAEEGKYTGDIKKCMEARDKGTAKEIRNYVCPVGIISPQGVAFQVVMSLQFNELDKKIEADLQDLSNNSNKDLQTLTVNIDNLFSTGTQSKDYPSQYERICDELTIQEVIKSYPGNITTDNPTENFVFGWAGCRVLAKKKMQAYKESAWLLGEIAVVNSFKNDKHIYMRRLKDQYEKFLEKWTIYISQLSVIKDKWPSKTPKVQK